MINNHINPLKDDFWLRLGKFFKRLGPIVPIASAACYLFPELSAGRSLQVFYMVFVCLTGYFCFLHPKTLEQKLKSRVYVRGTHPYRQKQIAILIDAFFMALIAFSLACLMCIMLFKLPATPLVEFIQSGQPLNLPMSMISAFSLCVMALRYHQKKHALSLKSFAFELKSTLFKDRIDQLNQECESICQFKHRMTRLVCDCLVVFYNIFFVGFSLAMMFFSAQLTAIFQGLFIWKMVAVSSLVTARIACANKKLSSDYLACKLSAIADVSWKSQSMCFELREDSHDNAQFEA